MMRNVATCVVWHFMPSVMDNVKKPWHAPYLEIHLMGIQRSMYRNDRLSDRFNNAVGIEWMYKKMGLVSYIGLN